MSKKLVSLALILIIASACNRNKSPLAEYGHIFESVVLYDQGVFRGFSLGDNFKKVTEKELGKPIEKDTDYLYYEYKIDSATTFNIVYRFDEKGELNEIQSDIFIVNKVDVAEETFNVFNNYLTEHYGDSESEGGFNVWSIRSDKYGDVKISLSNETPAFTTANAIGKISLWIYPDKN